MNENNSEVRVKFEIGDIKFEAEGSADLVNRERDIFTNILLPSAVDAIERTRGVSQGVQFVESNEQLTKLPAGKDDLESPNSLSEQEGKEDYSRTSLASFLDGYGSLTEQDFTLLAAYYDEVKNGTRYFTKNDVEKYYDEARKPKPANISMSLHCLAKSGHIMDAPDVEQKIPIPYMITAKGIKYVKEYQPKEKKEKKPDKARKPRAKAKSVYIGINCDELNLNKYPVVSGQKDFIEKMMLILYIITNEKKGEWFTVTDILYLMNEVFGEAATKDQITGVFNREKKWFLRENVEDSSKAVRRKLLNEGIQYASGLTTEHQ